MQKRQIHDKGFAFLKNDITRILWTWYVHFHSRYRQWSSFVINWVTVEKSLISTFLWNSHTIISNTYKSENCFFGVFRQSLEISAILIRSETCGIQQKPKHPPGLFQVKFFIIWECSLLRIKGGIPYMVLIGGRSLNRDMKATLSFWTDSPVGRGISCPPRFPNPPKADCPSQSYIEVLR